MHAKVLLVCLLLLSASSVLSAEEPRFEGSTRLTPERTQKSPDARFALTAKLVPAPQQLQTDASARFGLKAALQTSGGVCAGSSDELFQNGFESP